MSNEIQPIRWEDGMLWLLDQRLLPQQERTLAYQDWRAVVGAIRDMVVRGAPAIGVTAAYALALAAKELEGTDWRPVFCDICEEVSQARPTAVNLVWAVNRMRDAAEGVAADRPYEKLLAAAKEIHANDIETNRALASHGAALIPNKGRVLTICNTGALATGGYGTALGVIRAAHEQSREPYVWVSETRPRLQGMRLTAWELEKLGVPYRIITDNMAGSLMRQGRVELVIAGADRIAANGDTANKIGTYSLAVLAKSHGIPFYIAAPTSTIDLTIETGDKIPIEERSEEEITEIGGVRMAPIGARSYNPAFDVTPNELITGIITETGVLSAPFGEALQRRTY
jgi:methylthioribose-1-phosphate isomerase